MNRKLANKILWLASIGVVVVGVILVAFIARPYYSQALEKLTGRVQFNVNPAESVKEIVADGVGETGIKKPEPVKYVTAEKAQNTISIPTIGLENVPVVYPNNNDYETIENGLEHGVVHLANTETPKAKSGVTYIIGHSSNFEWAGGDYNYVFKNLSTLENGNTIRVQYDRKRYDYTVTDKKFITYEEAVNMEFGEGEKVLVVMTCWPNYSSRARVAIIAKVK